MGLLPRKMRKPYPVQGYEIRPHVEYQKRTYIDRDGTQRTSMGQTIEGLGVNGPNLVENNPKKLRQLADYLNRAADYLENERKKR